MEQEQDRLEAEADQGVCPHVFALSVEAFIAEPPPGRDEEHKRQSEIQAAKKNREAPIGGQGLGGLGLGGFLPDLFSLLQLFIEVGQAFGGQMPLRQLDSGKFEGFRQVPGGPGVLKQVDIRQAVYILFHLPFHTLSPSQDNLHGSACG